MNLKNINHSFDVEIGDVGCTIRKGTKWSETERGTYLVLWDCAIAHNGSCGMGCKPEGIGKVVGSWVGEFGKIPKNLLRIEHNIKSRDMEVLREMMKEGYGDIHDEDIVTALIYERIVDSRF